MRACFLLLSSLAIACGGRVDSEAVRADGGIDVDAQAPPARTLEEACRDQVDAVCADLAKCGSFEERWRYGDEARCRREHSVRCLRDGKLPDVLDSVGAADRCTAAIRGAACGTWGRESAWLRECLGVGARGPRADGSPCLVNAQCAGGLCAVTPGSKPCGRCARAPTAGAPCAADFPDCTLLLNNAYTTGLWCDEAARHCVEPPPSSALPAITLVSLGGACELPTPDLPSTTWCAAGGFCDFRKTCLPTRALGESCRGVALECGWDATCVHASPDEFGTCTPLVDVCK